jgi:hypothetical protein
VVLRDHRDRLRASERAKSLDAAGQVEGRLMLVLVLCYLPALMLLVVIPLFRGLLDGYSLRKPVYTDKIEADRASLARE